MFFISVCLYFPNSKSKVVSEPLLSAADLKACNLVYVAINSFFQAACIRSVFFLS